MTPALKVEYDLENFYFHYNGRKVTVPMNDAQKAEVLAAHHAAQKQLADEILYGNKEDE